MSEMRGCILRIERFENGQSNHFVFFWRAGDILANIWYSDIIIRIDVETGIVKTIYDFKSLWPSHERSSLADCFNGIAVLDDDVLMVTGKLWPKMYKVKLDD